jgi:hypothetical protein
MPAADLTVWRATRDGHSCSFGMETTLCRLRIHKVLIQEEEDQGIPATDDGPHHFDGYDTGCWLIQRLVGIRRRHLVQSHCSRRIRAPGGHSPANAVALKIGEVGPGRQHANDGPFQPAGTQSDHVNRPPPLARPSDLSRPRPSPIPVNQSRWLPFPPSSSGCSASPQLGKRKAIER